MPQAAVARPLRERDLRHELGADPEGAGRHRLEGRERRRVLLELAQPPAQFAQRCVVEAGAHLAGVAERAVLVVAHEERAEVGPRSPRSGEAADHELLLRVALQLQPVARATARVRAVGALRDHALEPLLARLAEELLAVLALAMRVEADRPLEPERPP